MNRKPLFFIVLIALSLIVSGCGPSPSVASPTPAWPPEGTLSAFSTPLGGNEDVYDLAFDHSGQLWITSGTSGVSRYDGKAWTTFKDIGSIPAEKISTLFVDSRGDVWLGAVSQRASFEAICFLNRTSTTPLAGCATEVFDSYIQAADPGGIVRYSNGGWTTFRPGNGLLEGHVEAIYEDVSGGFWIGGTGGISHFDGKNWTTSYTSYSEAQGDLNVGGIYSIFQDADGNLWFGGADGVLRFDGSHWKRFTQAEGLPGYSIQSIVQDYAKNLWFASSGGIAKYDGNVWTIYSIDSGLPDSNVLAILFDSRGYLWAGTQKGVAVLGSDGWVTPPVLAGLQIFINNIISGPDGTLWFGTEQGISKFTINP